MQNAECRVKNAELKRIKHKRAEDFPPFIYIINKNEGKIYGIYMLICASIRNFSVLSKYFDRKSRENGFKMRIFSINFVTLHKNGGFDLAFDENPTKNFSQHIDISIYIW